MEAEIPCFPEASLFKSYDEYCKAVENWYRYTFDYLNGKITTQKATAFLRRPYFDPYDVMYKSRFPKGQKQLEYVDSILKGEKTEEFPNWIFPPINWTAYEINPPPFPGHFKTENDFRDASFLWKKNVDKILKANAIEFGKAGLLQQRSLNITVKDSVEETTVNLFSPEEMEKVAVVGSKAKNPCALSRQSYEKQEYFYPKPEEKKFSYSCFYKRIMRKCKPFESKDHILAYSYAYKSLPLLKIDIKSDYNVKDLLANGPTTAFLSPHLNKSKTKLPALSSDKMLTLAHNNIKNISEKDKIALFETILNMKNTASLKILDDNYVLDAFISAMNEIYFTDYEYEKPRVSDAIQLHYKNLLRIAHDVIARCVLLNVLLEFANTYKHKNIKNYAKDSIKHSENALNSFLAKNKAQLISDINNQLNNQTAGIILFIISAASSLGLKECKNFIKSIGFGFFITCKRKVPEYFSAFRFAAISHVNLNRYILIDLSKGMEDYINDIYEMIPFITPLLQLKGKNVPQCLVEDCGWVVLIVSTITNNIRATLDSSHVYFAMSAIKMLMRWRKKNKNAKVPEWQRSVVILATLLSSLIEYTMNELHMQHLLEYELASFVALIPEKSIFDFFKRVIENGSMTVFTTMNSDNIRVAKLGYKIISNLLVYHTADFIEMTQPGTEFREFLVQTIKKARIALHIDILNMLRKFLEKYVPKDPTQQESQVKVGLLFSVVNLPPNLITFVQFLNDAGFQAIHSVKAILKNRSDPDIAPYFTKLERFWASVKRRKTVKRLLESPLSVTQQPQQQP